MTLARLGTALVLAIVAVWIAAFFWYPQAP